MYQLETEQTFLVGKLVIAGNRFRTNEQVHRFACWPHAVYFGLPKSTLVEWDYLVEWNAQRLT